MPIVPEQVSFDDFQAALKPLLDLCGVGSKQILIPIHITPGDLNDGVHAHISFQVVAAEAADVGSDDPPGFRLVDAPQPFTVLTYPVSVDVVTYTDHECEGGCELCEGTR